MEQYEASGYEPAFLARVPTGGCVGYMDTTRDPPGVVELIELGASFDLSGYDRLGWRGTRASVCVNWSEIEEADYQSATDELRSPRGMKMALDWR